MNSDPIRAGVTEQGGATIIPFPERKIVPDMAGLREIFASVENNDSAHYLAIAQAAMLALGTHQRRKTGDLQGIINCVACGFFALGLALEYFTLEDLT